MTLEELKELTKGKKIVVLSDLKDLIETGEIKFKIIDINKSELFEGTYAELIALEKEKFHKPSLSICGDIYPLSEEAAQIALNNIEAGNTNLRNSLRLSQSEFKNSFFPEPQRKHTEWSPAPEDNLTIDSTISGLHEPQFGFTCQICGDTQMVKYYSPNTFPICDNCKSDLKDYVVTLRRKRL